MRAFVREGVIPAEPDCSPRGPDEPRASSAPAARAAGRSSRRTRRASWAGSAWTSAPAASSSRRPATACSGRSRSTARRPTRATCTCWQVADRAAEGALPGAARRGRGPLVLRHDRARTRAPAPTRPCCAPRAGACDGGWVIDGRKWFITGADGARFAIVHGPHRASDRRGAARRCSSSTPTTPACGSARSIPTHRRAFRRRPLRGRASTTAWSATTPCWARSGAGFDYAQVRLAPGAADPLHALARRARSARWTSRSTTPPSARRSAARWPTSDGPGDDRRLRDRPATRAGC